jgi:hypothetical protein
MPRRNALLTEAGRKRLARCIVEDGWPVRRGRRAVSTGSARSTVIRDRASFSVINGCPVQP